MIAGGGNDFYPPNPKFENPYPQNAYPQYPNNQISYAQNPYPQNSFPYNPYHQPFNNSIVQGQPIYGAPLSNEYDPQNNSRMPINS